MDSSPSLSKGFVGNLITLLDSNSVLTFTQFLYEMDEEIMRSENLQRKGKDVEVFFEKVVQALRMESNIGHHLWRKSGMASWFQKLNFSVRGIVTLLTMTIFRRMKNIRRIYDCIVFISWNGRFGSSASLAVAISLVYL